MRTLNEIERLAYINGDTRTARMLNLVPMRTIGMEKIDYTIADRDSRQRETIDDLQRELDKREAELNAARDKLATIEAELKALKD